MKKLLRKTLLLVNIILAALIICSSLSVHISPLTAWPFAFLGLAYPFLMIGNLGFLVFWLIFKRKYSLLSLSVILLTWNHVIKFIQIDLKKEKVPENILNVKLLSYNVRIFNFYQWLNDKTIPDNILNFISKEKAGIICLQEFITVQNSNISVGSLKKRLSGTPYSHIVYSYDISRDKKMGLATFSQYPIINKGTINFENSPNGIIYSDIKIKKDTIRVYNCHLQSTRLRKDDFHLIDSILLKYDDKHITNFKQLTYRLKDAYKLRATQADILSDHIRKSPHPAIVCGDFNDTPVSYTYYKIKGKFIDAFIESGTGIGDTYLGYVPHFRIDYILHDKKIKTNDFQVKRVKYSDHYPISTNCYFPDYP